MCVLYATIKQQHVRFFGVHFSFIFPSFFLHFLFKKAVPHGIIKPTKTERFCAAFKVQAGISGSALFIISAFAFCSLSLSFFSLSSSSSSSSSSLQYLFSKSLLSAIFFSLLLNLLPPRDKRVAAQEEEEEEEEKRS